MLYALILTTIISGKYVESATVAQTTTPGFTSEQACENAGRVAQSKAITGIGRYNEYAIVTFQCAKLSV